MARSAGGGGGHSSGGGGRSFGGGSRSSSRSFGSSGRSSGGSSGSYRRAGSGYSSSSSSYGNRPSGSYRRGGSYYGGSGGYYGGPGRYHRGGGYYRGGGAPVGSGSGGCGCFSIVIIVLICMIIFSGTRGGSGSSSSSSSSNKSNAYLAHDKYTGNVDSSHGFYIDDSEGSEKFIDSSNKNDLNDGFDKFYSKTGVYPFLYIIERVPSGNGSADSIMQNYTDDLYEELFNSEGNLLFVYVASEDDYWAAGGHNIRETIDEDAMKVIYSCINARWDDGNLARRFGDGLEDAAKHVMGKSPYRVVMIVLIVALAVVVILYIVYSWWQKKKKAEKEEAEHLEQILSTPLESFGTQGMDDLKNKYDGGNDGGNPPINPQ